MTEAKWTAVDEGDGNFAIRTRQGPIEVQIARVFDPTAAPLISAAPELYEALSALRDLLASTPAMQGREYLDLGIQVNRALSKARGDL